MIGKFLKSATGIAIGLPVALILLVMFFTEKPYSQEEIDWCAAERPDLTMEVCLKLDNIKRKNWPYAEASNKYTH